MRQVPLPIAPAGRAGAAGHVGILPRHFLGGRRVESATRPLAKRTVELEMTESLMARVARGDEAAVAEIIDQYGSLVWAIARRLTRNPSDAEDAVQEIFTDVWRSAHRYNAAAGTEKVFITTIARRRLIDRMRRVANRVQTESSDVLDELGFHTPDTAADVSVEAELAARVMQKLRPEQRQVIELGLLQGLSHSEIAGITGMPLGTVKTFMRRGLIQVREMLGVTGAGLAGEGEA